MSDILRCLGDNKKHMRECTLTALDAWLAAVHLDKMVTVLSYLYLGQFWYLIGRFHGNSVVVGSICYNSTD